MKNISTVKSLFAVLWCFLGAASLLATNLMVTSPASAQNTAENARSDAEIEALVHDYIINNPTVILEALQRLEAQRQQDALADQKRQIAANHDILVASEHQTVLGNPEGDVTLIEFFDYNCSFCRQIHTTVEELIATDPSLKVILKEFPVLGPASQTAARVSIAASKTDPQKFPALHKKLLEVPGSVDQDIALEASRALGMNIDEIKSLMDTPQMDEAITEVYQLAADLGIDGTPSFVLGNELIVGAVGIDVLQQKIASLRECGETDCS